jgi:hypothetical protein
MNTVSFSSARPTRAQGARPRTVVVVAALALALALLGLMPSPPPAHAGSSTVDCGPDRTARLIEAVRAANSGGPSTVTLTPGCAYTLTTFENTGERGSNALPVITGNVTIAGNGAAITHTRRPGDNSYQPYRMAQVNEGATLVLQDLTIGYFALQIAPGGALAVYGGTLTMTNTTLNGAKSEENGGALYVQSGSATVTGSTFSGNDSYRGGGAIGMSGGTVVVTNSTLTDNRAAQGGGLAVFGGTLTVQASAVTRNWACFLGGGLHVPTGGTAHLTNTTISGNSAQPDLPLSFCEGQLPLGGGVYAEGTVTLTNTTVSGNWTKGWQAPNFPPGRSHAGGVFSWGGVTVTNTLIAKNTRINDSANEVSGNCLGSSLINGGNNMQDVDTSCADAIPVNNPLLAGDGGRTSGLEFNGGPTRTVALQAGSPAINAGKQTTCSAAPVSNRDQRGFTRVGTCDIGAYEFGATGAAIQPPVVTKSYTPSTITLGGSSVLRLTITNPNAALHLTGVSVTDTLPAGIEVHAVATGANTCNGAVTATAGTRTVKLTGGALTAGASCSVSVTVRGTLVGALTSATGPVTATESGAGAASAPATLTVEEPDGAGFVTGDAGGGIIPVGRPFSFTFVVANTEAAPATVANLAVTLPSGILVTGVEIRRGGVVVPADPTNGPHCTWPTPGKVTCNLGALATGEALTVQVKATRQSAPPAQALCAQGMATMTVLGQGLTSTATSCAR